MKLANYRGRATVVTPDGGIDIAEATGGRFGPTLQSVYDEWEAFRAVGSDLSGAGAVALEDGELGPPSPFPRQVFAIGINYASHAKETGAEAPKKPATFTKFPTCLNSPFGDIVLPEGRVDWEVELVLVIGAQARMVTEGKAWDHIAGVTVGQDISERRLQMAAGMQFSLGKSYPGFGPTGPWLVTVDELDDPNDLGLGCSVDGETMQDARTTEMFFNVPALIAELSAVVTLLPGDIIFTGTPGGVGVARDPRRFLKAGEVLESWIEGIGTIRNRIVGQ